jgi:hypothetical protein
MSCENCDTACSKCGCQVSSGEKPDYPNGECANCHFGLGEGYYFPTKERHGNCEFCNLDAQRDVEEAFIRDQKPIETT